jgi:hypothetical protein
MTINGDSETSSRLAFSDVISGETYSLMRNAFSYAMLDAMSTIRRTTCFRRCSSSSWPPRRMTVHPFVASKFLR